MRKLETFYCAHYPLLLVFVKQGCHFRSQNDLFEYFYDAPPPPLTFMVLKTMCVNGGAGDSNGVMREWVNLLLYYSLVPWLCFVPPCLVYYKHLFFAFSLCQWGTPTITRVARPSSTDCCRLTERYR